MIRVTEVYVLLLGLFQYFCIYSIDLNIIHESLMQMRKFEGELYACPILKLFGCIEHFSIDAMKPTKVFFSSVATKAMGELKPPLLI